MRIAIDMGNSKTAVALFNEDGIVAVGRVPTERFGRPGDVSGLLADVLGELRADGAGGAGGAAGEWEGSVVASVVPAPLEALVTALSRLHPGEPLVVGPSVDLGIRIGYERPEELGPDRIADAVAGHAAAGGAAIVVDLGTATTFNAVTAEGVFLGGAIAPGIGTAADALARSAARLFRPSFDFPARAIGRSTDESLRSGILWGAAAMIDGMIGRMREELGGAVAIATGGHSSLVGPHLRSIDWVDELLTLRGLMLLDERNRGGSRPARRG